MQHSVFYPSPLGRLHIVSDGTRLTALHFATAPADSPGANCPALTRTIHWLDAYFAHKPLPPLPPLAPKGTPFQQTVWQLLLQIPYGSSVTYGELARSTAKQLGKPRMSAQAIGQAVSQNPIALLIPCHRVLGVRNKLTGYAGGLDKKIALLRLENISFTR